MNLRKDLADYIHNVGVEAAAEKFGKAQSTVKAWIKTGNFPVDAVEKFINENLGEAIPPVVATVTHTTPAPYQEPTLEQRVEAIENYLVQLNQSAPQPTQPNPINAPRVAWAPPGPGDGNFQSFVRPERGVPGTTLSTPARDAAPAQPAPPQAGVRAGMKPADTWLTPIPRK